MELAALVTTRWNADDPGMALLVGDRDSHGSEAEEHEWICISSLEFVALGITS